MSPDEQLIDEATLVKRLSVPLKSFQNRLSRGDIDIPFIRIGKRQRRYHWPTVLSYLQNNALSEAKNKTSAKEFAPINVPGRRGRPRRLV